MYFIGAGALLYQAISFAHLAGYPVYGACLPQGDAVSARISRMGLTVVESNEPEQVLPPLLTTLKVEVVFSINNKFLLSDSLLQLGPRFFNIHNGLVQNYRGIAEVCLFAAICRGEQQYGATMHQLLPSQKVDSGPVVNQSSFELSLNETFADALKKSLDNCQKLFQLSLAGIMDGSLLPMPIEVSRSAYSYHDIDVILATADPKRLSNACNLGVYAGFFPRLQLAVTPNKVG